MTFTVDFDDFKYGIKFVKGDAAGKHKDNVVRCLLFWKDDPNWHHSAEGIARTNKKYDRHDKGFGQRLALARAMDEFFVRNNSGREIRKKIADAHQEWLENNNVKSRLNPKRRMNSV